MLHAIIGALIFLSTVGLIMVRPRRVTEAVAAAGGALMMLLGGYVGLGEALALLRSQWNVYGFFLGLMMISALADQAGVFEVMTNRIAHWSKGNTLRLYLAVFLIGTVITAVLSNDATALILTPVVYVLVTRLRLSPLPFLFACTFIADTASFLLPVSNPINILVINAFGGGLGTFLRFLLLPSLFCIGLNIGLFIWLFRRDLKQRYNLGDLPPVVLNSPTFLHFAFGSLAVIGLAYVLAAALRLPLSIVSLGGSALLFAGALRHHRFDWNKLKRELSWSLFIFITGMFLIVRAIENLGLTQTFGRALLHLGGDSPLRATMLTAGGTALGSNLINNVPMTLIMISAQSAIQTSGRGHATQVYAIIFGADLGPNLTTVGSLATMLWLLALRRKGVDISTIEYFKLGIAVVPLMIIVGSVLLWLRL
jgi:arsenical pump membrane protein